MSEKELESAVDDIDQNGSGKIEFEGNIKRFFYFFKIIFRILGINGWRGRIKRKIIRLIND